MSIMFTTLQSNLPHNTKLRNVTTVATMTTKLQAVNNTHDAVNAVRNTTLENVKVLQFIVFNAKVRT